MLYFKAEKKKNRENIENIGKSHGISLDRSVATLVFTRYEIKLVTEIRTDIILY